ncbi:hypothetical protein GE21DRAFT_115 [Neurospora crassa]|uniref:Small ribosomal subunit protein mS46 n=2 Tax=Neurospora crassa TaxID=5141 RepID=RSM28_NEUCR|nr:hypothetical protein NCU07493 [Neurospora crassa OR74A]Q7SG49.1 RecName: Full=Small ribosomal subunit protein mS46 [Neurospora crassa OR74A]6YW5_77 Chain 77, mS46 [Neurospora crassa OR74A]6YWE_77 Chain 77, mS46 [Neurospora crassa]6YWX_77 Chain 77, mS46 [Neurospora crassa OR74A]6YWY_77 Chain 77, mS46 [Neurospora crassa]EAA35804.1 hypothetical protein NCU07493 [Neurospora crassa OR74A]KHE84481.1 hypothetical protein GE21DRAFT_115 [Neurospora crassa]|eukprot:XP_965040.1 hypothetical protein NCU07493 [Neurospora crassa OR74A]
MNRQVVTSTLGRRGVASTILNAQQQQRPFSSTTTRCAAEDDSKKPAAAPSTPRAAAPGPISASRQKSEAAVGKLTQLRGSFTSLTNDNSFHKTLPAGARDARRLAAAPIAGKGAGAGAVAPLGGGGGASGAPKVINVRSLKGTLGSRGSNNIPGAVAPGAALRPRFAAGPGAAAGRPRFGAAASPGAGPTGAARRPPFGARRARPAGDKKRSGGSGDKRPRGDDYDAPPTEEEKAFLRGLEQGKVTEYVPKLTPDTLLGYGPPVATDAALGKVESAMRTMRILGGGLPFNDQSGVTSDPTAIKHRYVHEKKPVFFSSVEEKEWVRESLDKFAVSEGPEKKTKQKILETSVLGKYEEPKYVESLTETVKMVEKYQGGTFSYAPSDADKFNKKLNQLLAAGLPRAAPAPAQAQKKA